MNQRGFVPDHQIKIITCGGTIDKIYFDAKSDFEVGNPQILTILDDSNITVKFDVKSILRKDSLDMTDEDRNFILQTVADSPEQRILITHGTDSMIHTGLVLKTIQNKTIVITGSMQPAKFKVTDAYFNIGAAFAAVQILPAGVYIVMNGKILDPSRIAKNIGDSRFEENE